MNLRVKYLLFLFSLLYTSQGQGQGSNCSTSDPFCTGTTYNFPNSTNSPDLGTIDCCTTTPNPAWYYLQIATAGPISITINQTATGGSGIDVDFVMFGPYNSLNQACSVIPGGNVVDCSYSTAAVETAFIPNAQVGQIYVLLLTNFSNQSGNIQFSQTGGTGATDCSIVIPCDITQVTANPSPCNATDNTYNVTGNVSFTDPPTTGTMTITNSCGGTPVVYNAPFVSPLSYQFFNLNSTGSNCSINVAFSAAQSCIGSGTYFAPAGCVPCDLVIDNVVVDSVTCYGACDGSITITASGSQAPFTYSIDNGATTQASPVFNNLCAGNYTVWVRDAGGLSGVCTVTQAETIFEPDQLLAAETNTDTDCGTCLGEIDIDVSGGAGTYQYSIDNGVTYQSGDLFSNLCIGTYSILIEDEHQCQTSVTSVIDALNGPEITNVVITNTTCPNSCDGEIIISATNSVEYSIDGGTTFSTNNNFTNLCAGNYIVFVDDGLGCDDQTPAIVLNPPHIPVSFYYEPERPTVFHPEVEFINTTPGSNSYFWTIDTLDNFNSTNVDYAFPGNPFTYEVCLYATDMNECVDSTCQYITVYDEAAFFVPNAFTPNGDGLNDEFYVYSTGIDPATFQVLIFNRWGNLIYESNDPKFRWNGVVAQGPASDKVMIDVYVWRIRGVSYATQEIFEKRGHVTIVR